MAHYLIPEGSPAPLAGQTEGRPLNEKYYLPEGLPVPITDPGSLHGPYWQGAQDETLKVQRNPATGVYQWPPQWITHDTQSFELEWVEVAPKGMIYSWTRIWHPIHPALKDAVPYLIVVVELPHAGGIRMLGNLLGDPHQKIEIGAQVEAVFEHHDDAVPPFTLVQWRTISG